MGYRSDVTMVLKGPALKEVFALMDAAGLYLADHWDDEEYGISGDTFLFHVTDVKWYTMSNFADVEMIERMWEFAVQISDEAEKEDPGNWRYPPLDGRFVRLGENSDDEEVRDLSVNSPELFWVEKRVDFGINYNDIIGKNDRNVAQRREETTTG